MSGPLLFSSELTGQAHGSSQLLPDFRGLNVRDALKALAQLGMPARVLGNGIVVGQQPSPGSPIERGAIATLRLERHVSVDTSSLPPLDTPQ